MIERREDYDSMEEYTEAIRDETTDDTDGNNDVQISRTTDGYVIRLWY